MKKSYSKPQIMFEDFSLSTNIATCDITNMKDPDLYWEGFGYVFKSGCEKPIESDMYNSICYHNPENSVNTHNS